MSFTSTTSCAVPALPAPDNARSDAACLSHSLARLLLLATVLAAPLPFGAVQTWAWASLALLANLALILWAAGSARQRVLRIAWSPLYLPAALFVLLGAIQFFGHLTLDAIATREALLKLATYLILFFLAGQLFRSDSERTLPRFGITVLVFAFGLSLFAILQFFSSRDLIYWSVKSPGWAFGPYVNHNHYAGLMELTIPIAMAYALSRPESYPGRALLGFAVLVPLASMPLSGSRGGLIALAVEISLLVAILLRRECGRQILGPVGVLGITAAALLFFWLAPGENLSRLATLANVAGSVEATLGDRKITALDSLGIFRDHPWLGVGMGSFETAYPRYQSYPSDLVTDHAHNDYAEALAETGLAGGLLILAALAMFFRLAFTSLGERLRQEAGWIQLGAGVGCCGLLVHSFVDFNLRIPANAAWFAVCAAVATSPNGRRTWRPPKHTRSLEAASRGGVAAAKEE